MSGNDLITWKSKIREASINTYDGIIKRGKEQHVLTKGDMKNLQNGKALKLTAYGLVLVALIKKMNIANIKEA